MKTTQEKIEDIRKACIAANKDIAELKFGCYFTWTPEKGTEPDTLMYLDEHKTVGGTLAWHAVAQDVYHEDFQFDPEMSYEGEIKIIGREILAQDVACILPRNWMLKGHKDGRIEFVDMTDFGNSKFENNYILWKGRTLEDQPPEKIDRIHNLILQ